ncbi:MAG: DNA polymerase III subunit delta [Armatimonadota bacterium]
MKRTYAEHQKAKDKTCLGKWVLLTGPEQELKRALLAQIKQEAEAASPDDSPSWEVLDGPSATAKEVLARAQTAALFGGARVVVIREADRIPASRRRRADDDEEADGDDADGKPDEQRKLAKAVGALPLGVVVVLVTGEGRDRRTPDVTAPLRNAIAKEGLVIVCPEMKEGEAAAWAIARAKALGKKLDPTAARKLVGQKVGSGLAELEQEVEKLVLFVGDRDRITAAEVDEVTPRLLEEDVFRLLDAVSRKEPGHAVAIVRGLLGERRAAPPLILWQLAQSLRELWQVKLLTERGWRPGEEADEESQALLPQDPRKNVLKRLTGNRAWLASRLAQQSRSVTWSQLTSAVQAVHSCDLAMKRIRGAVSDDETALELLVIQLCTGAEIPLWQSAQGERVLG